MNAAPIHIGTSRLMLDPGGAIFWPQESILAIADLHFEKATHYAEKGQLLPPWDTALTLDRLAPLIRRYAPKTLIALGDSFHDARGASRIGAKDAARIAQFAETLDLIWVLGNHDPTPPDGLPGRAVDEYQREHITFRHHPLAGGGHEVFGHFHPRATIQARGGSVTRPCFMADSRRVLLPAFGAFTGGLDVRNPAIARLFPRGARAFLLGKERLYSFTLTQLRNAEAPAMKEPPLQSG